MGELQNIEPEFEERSGMAVALDEAGLDPQERFEFATTFIATHKDERLPSNYIAPRKYDLAFRDGEELPPNAPASLGEFTLREELATAFRAFRRFAAGQRRNW